MNKNGCPVSRGVHFSGNANNGTNCGFVYSNANNAPSNTNANIGSRKCLNVSAIADAITKIYIIGNHATKTIATCHVAFGMCRRQRRGQKMS